MYFASIKSFGNPKTHTHRTNGKTMRIALPIADGKFSLHYGRAQALRLYDIDQDKGIATSLGERPYPDSGTCSAGAWVAEQGVEVLLAGGLGGGAAQGMAKHGIKVLAGVQEENPEKVLESFLSGIAKVVELAPGEALCQGHDGESAHEHEEGHVCHCGH